MPRVHAIQNRVQRRVAGLELVRRLHTRTRGAIVELDVRPEPPLRALGPILRDGVDRVLVFKFGVAK